VSLYADLDTGERFVHFPGAGGLTALQANDGKTEAVTTLPPLRHGLHRPVGSAFEQSPPDPPPVVVA
jgi:hypothetical protein